MANDFLITFTVDGTAAIAMLNQIGALAVETAAKVNAVQNIGGGAGAAAGATNALAGATNNLAGASNNAATAQAKVVAAQAQVAQATEESTSAFARHTQRILEAIVIYEAFGKAVQAIQAGIGLVIDIDRESRRLEAVLNIDPAQSAKFIQDLGQIASETVTPFEHLVAEADSAAAAFLDAKSPAEQYASALELMRDAGKFTTITQHDLAQELGNLTAIMKQFNIPIDQLDDFLGKIVVAGGNSSTVIAGLTDAMRVSAQAAEEAGLKFNSGFAEVLLASESQFLIATRRTGSEVGAVFKLLITRLANPNVVDNVEKISNGMLKLRDATGAIRNPLQVLADLNALLKSGAIDAQKFNDIFAAIAPPLNPAAVQDFKLITRQLSGLGPIVDKIGKANVENLDDLVKKINDALGPQFQKLLIDAQRGFVNLFGPTILSAGKSIIDVLRVIGNVIGVLPPQVVVGVTAFLGLFAAVKLLSFATTALGSILGIGGLTGTMFKLGAATVVVEGETVAAGTAFKLFGLTAFTAGGLVKGLISQMVILLPLVAAWMAFDFAGKVGEMQAGLKEQVGGSLVGQNLAGLQKIKADLEGQIKTEASKAQSLNPLDLFGNIGHAATLNPLTESLAEVNHQIRELQHGGPDAKVTVDGLSDGFKSITDPAKAAADSMSDAQKQLQDLLQGATDNAAGFAGMDQAQRNAAASAELLAGLADDEGKALLDLNDRLKEGKISSDQWTAGQDQVHRAAQVSSQLVGAFHDQLRLMLPELAGAAKGDDALAAALFKVVLGAGNALPGIEAITNAAVNMANAAGAAGLAVSLWADAQAHLAATMSASGDFNAHGGDALLRLRAVAATGSSAGNFIAQLQRAMQQLSGLFRGSGNTVFGTGLPPAGSKAGAASKPSTPILDIGDLPANQLAKLIAIATTLRNKIPGETAADKGSVVALIKDAQFLRNVKGIDEKLLRIALDQLTAQMKKANDLAAKQNLLQNLVVRAGPLSGLLSQPTSFGIGGLTSGNGLNFDPTKGNFTINVPVELKGLDPARLQQLIYNIIYKAIQEANRT